MKYHVSNTGTNFNNTDNNTVTSFFSFNLCSNQLLNGSKSLPLLLACHPLVITHMELCQWHKALMELLPQLLQCLLRLPLSINIFYNHFHSHFRAPHRHLRRRFAECEIKTKLSLNRESPKKKNARSFVNGDTRKLLKWSAECLASICLRVLARNSQQKTTKSTVHPTPDSMDKPYYTLHVTLTRFKSP